MRNQQ